MHASNTRLMHQIEASIARSGQHQTLHGRSYRSSDIVARSATQEASNNMIRRDVCKLTHAVLRSTANSAAEREPVSRRDF